MFITCAEKWNEKEQKFEETDLTDAAICCNKQCEEPVNFCYNYCRNNPGEYNTPTLLYRCMKTCEDQKKICLDTCSLSSKYNNKNNNDYINCANIKGCVYTDMSANVECLLDNKQDIFNCCSKSCIPSVDLDCDKNCKYLESFYLNPVSTLEPPKDNMQKNSYKKEYKHFVYIFLVLFIVSFILVFFTIRYSKRN
jgi:hypothetical protein